MNYKSLSLKVILRVVPISVTFYSTSQSPLPSSNGPNMVQPTLANFLDWTNNHPLVFPANSLDIPSIAFKVLPKYEGKGKTPYEHYQDVSHLALSFNILNESIMTCLLVHSFEGKVVEWFKNLTLQSLTTWG